MSRLSIIATVALFLTISCSAQQNEKQAEFPTKDEIQLAVTQSERALEQYKQSLVMEGELPTAKQNLSGVEKDRTVVKEAAKMIAALKVNPEGFNGVGGLLLLSLLDDASRNAALCSGTAFNDSMQSVMTNGDAKVATDWLRIGQRCVDVSGFLYTVGESVQALLIREMQAQEQMNQQVMETADKVKEAIKLCQAKQ